VTDQPNTTPKTFDEWMSQLRALFMTEAPGYISTADDDWREFYEDGCSPREALYEDLRNGL
jgi:hypothetical protein